MFQSVVVESTGKADSLDPKRLEQEVSGRVDELCVFVLEDEQQMKARRNDIHKVILPLLQQGTLRRGREHIVDYRYLIRKKQPSTVNGLNDSPLWVELYKGTERKAFRIEVNELPEKATEKVLTPYPKLLQILEFFQPMTLGYDPTQSRVAYNKKEKSTWGADAMSNLKQGFFSVAGDMESQRGLRDYGPDGMPLKDGGHKLKYGPDGQVEAVISARPKHAVRLTQGWYRAESGRYEVEALATRHFHLICNVLDILKKTGRIQTGRWTNDPDIFPNELLEGEILPFPANERSVEVPQAGTDGGVTVLMITGATGNNFNIINGEYVHVGLFNGRRLFHKQNPGTDFEDHDGKWLRYVTDRKQWMIGETNDLYTNNCAGWCYTVDKDLQDPAKAKKWRVLRDGNNWEEQELNLVTLVSNEVRLARMLPDDGLVFEKGKATWHRLVGYSTFPAYECRVFPICTGRLNYGTAGIDGDDMGRVFKGDLDNSYFVEALNALSIRPNLIRRLFLAYDVAKSIYCVRIFKNGVWISVEIDDFVPKGKSPAYPLCCRHEYFPQILWPCLLEKAYAKSCTARFPNGDNDSGGWNALSGGGRVEEALVDLTGGVAGAFSTKDVSPDRLFVYFHELQRHCLWVCRVNLHLITINGVGLNPYAHYTVNRAVHCQGECYVQVRCVDQSNRHPDVGLESVVPWDVLPQLLKYPGTAKAGYIWFTILDFHQYFEYIYECRLVSSPDVGIVGMPPPKLPIAKLFPNPDWMIWASENIREHEDPVSALNEDNDLSHLMDAQKRSSPSQKLLAMFQGGGGQNTGAFMPGTGAAFMKDFGVVAPGAGHAWEALTEQSPLFYEHVFATESVVGNANPPQLMVSVPEVHCEIAIALEQVDNRIFQVGAKRQAYKPILLKVYQRVATTSGQHGNKKVYSNELVCKSEWTATRGSMVAWFVKNGGEFKVMVQLPNPSKIERLIFRVYTSVPYVDAHVSVSMAKDMLVVNKEPPLGIKYTLSGSVVPERLFRTDMAEPMEEDLDALRKKHLEQQKAMKHSPCPVS